MTFITLLVSWYEGHGTKILGTAAAIIPGLLGIDGLIAPANVKYWLATSVVIGALTVQRGFNNSKQEISK